MRICEYCDSVVAPNEHECPNCGASSFEYLCEECGARSKTAHCPQCRQRRESELERERAREQERKRDYERGQADLIRAQEEARDRQEAGSGVGWKVLLTFFLPFIGGYFLIVPGMATAPRIFGIFWCAIVGLGCLGTSVDILAGLFATLVCFGPIIAYAARLKHAKRP